MVKNRIPQGKMEFLKMQERMGELREKWLNEGFADPFEVKKILGLILMGIVISLR